MINSYDDLKAQRARAHNDLQVAKSKLDQDSRTWQEEVRPLKAVSSVASTLFTNPLVKKSKKGLVGTGVQMGINAVLGKTILKRLPTPLNIIVPHLVQNVALNYTDKNGRDWLIKGLRWIKDVTEEKPETETPQVEAVILVEETRQTLPATTSTEPIGGQIHSETR